MQNPHCPEILTEFLHPVFEQTQPLYFSRIFTATSEGLVNKDKRQQFSIIKEMIVLSGNFFFSGILS